MRYQFEVAVHLNQILEMLGWSRSKFYSKNKHGVKRYEELASWGAIFYRYEGAPPKKRICAYPSVLKDWVSSKSRKGEII